MDINATLLGQIITFLLLVWFTMRYVWPPITKAMREREMKIATGLDAAERAKQELELAHHKAGTILRDAKLQASHVIEQANKQAQKIFEEAKENGRTEEQRIVAKAQEEIQKEANLAQEKLKAEAAKLAILGAEKILQREINPETHADLLNKLVAQI